MSRKLTIAEQWLYDTLPNNADVEHVPNEVLESIGLVRKDWQRVYTAADVYAGYVFDNGLENDAHRMTPQELAKFVTENIDADDYEYLVALV